jgi:hypothetical protein
VLLVLGLNWLGKHGSASYSLILAELPMLPLLAVALLPITVTHLASAWSAYQEKQAADMLTILCGCIAVYLCAMYPAFDMLSHMKQYIAMEAVELAEPVVRPVLNTPVISFVVYTLTGGGLDLLARES